MNRVKIEITVPHYIAEYLVEMCDQEQRYHRDQDELTSAEEWRIVGDTIWNQIQDADECQTQD